jgi:hypothetical protein
MAGNKITTTVRIDEMTYMHLQQIATEEVRSLNNLIEYVLVKFIQEYVDKH